MEHRISEADLATKVRDVLARVCDHGDSFIVERNGKAVARVVPAAERVPATLGEAIAAWRAASEPDSEFADILEWVNRADKPPENPWG